MVMARVRISSQFAMQDAAQWLIGEVLSGRRACFAHAGIIGRERCECAKRT